MNDPSPEKVPAPPLSVLEQIEKACVQFETHCKADQDPRIESYLGEVAKDHASELFVELLRLELDYRARRGELPQRTDYLGRFADFTTEIDAALEQLDRTRHTGDETLDMVRRDTTRRKLRDPEPSIGDFGDYELLEEIARGGMGVVFKARDRRLQRTVAIKMILAGQLASPEAVHRFQAEAQAAAQLDHPSIVSVYEVGQHADQHFFSMAYIAGQSLEDRLSAGPMSPRESSSLLEQVARAVHYAHRQGVVHRDLKPANILLDVEGHPQITDFGLAKLATDDQQLTATGQILGTPGYMPPEQVSAHPGSTGPAADIYALGAILYRILTGRPPFQSTNVLETLFEVVEKEPMPPRALDRSVPTQLETICLKCLAKDPSQRYDSAETLADDLERFGHGEPIRAAAPNLFTRLFVWARQRPALAATVAALLGFYAYHLCMVYLWEDDGSGGRFHGFATGVAIVWLIAAWQFQVWSLNSPAYSQIVVYVWTAMEIILLTALLLYPDIDGPESSLRLVYLILLAGAALRGGPKLILFVYQLALGGYSLLVVVALIRAEVGFTFHTTIPFVVSLSVIALIQYMLVQQPGRR